MKPATPSNRRKPGKKTCASKAPKPFVRKKTPLPERPAQPPVPLPGIIVSQLKGLSTRALLVSWLQGGLWAAIAVCAMLLVQGSVDWLLDLSRGARLLFAIGDICVLGWLVYYYVIRPWRKKLTPEQAALRAEKKFPALRTSLIAAVQLAKSPEGSPHMVQALINQVAEQAAKIKFQGAVGIGHLKKYVITAAILFVVVAGVGFGFYPKSLILLKRILLSETPLPTQTIVVPVSGDFSISAGESIELTAKAQGVIPRTGRVEITYQGQATQTVSVTPKPSSPDTFSMTLPNVQQPLTYRFYLNDGRGPEFKAVIYHDPVLEKVSFEQIYPAYTGLPKTQQAPGNLSLLAGSKLHVEATADQPLKSAHIQLKGIDQKIDMTLSSDQKTISGEFSVPVKGLEGFSIVTQNEQGFESQANTLYRVEVVPDNPPDITFAQAQPDEATVVEQSQPHLHFQVRDDFQVKQVFLCCEIASTGADAAPAGNANPATAAPPKPDAPKPGDAKPGDTAPAKPNVIKIPIDVPKPAPSLAFDYEWKNPAESGLWKKGATISYWIEAVDNNDVTGPGVTDSARHQWTIVTLEEKRKELTDKLRQQADEIEHLSGQQRDLQSTVGDLIKKK